MTDTPIETVQDGIPSRGVAASWREPFSDVVQGRVFVDVAEERRELLAAEAGEQVARPQAGGERRADAFEDRVADGVAVGVVQRLEPVDVDHQQDARTPLLLQSRHLEREHRVEPAPVVERGQAVDHRQPLVVPAGAARLGQDRMVVAHSSGQHPQQVAGERRARVDERPDVVVREFDERRR